MKLLTRQEFMELPPGVLYAEFAPCTFGEVLIKGETIVHNGENIDWFHDGALIGDFEHGASSPIDDILAFNEKRQLKARFDYGGRDGCFDDTATYAVYEKEDLVDLIVTLVNCLKTGYAKGSAQ